MAATAEPPTATTDPLEGFSSSVRRVAARLGTTEVAAATVIGELLNDHPEYAERDSSPFVSRSPDLPVDEWLARVREFFDPDAVARSRSRVIDGRLTILALGRLVPDL